MRGTEVQKLAQRYLLPHLLGFRVKGRVIYAESIEDTLRGFDFEPSAFARARFTVTAFVQPLYVPSESIHYTFGRRLGELNIDRDKWWNITDADEATVMADVLHYMQAGGLSLLSQLRTPRDLAEKAGILIGRPTDPYVLEAIAYSWILVGDYAQAFNRFDQLRPILVRAKAVDERLGGTSMLKLETRVEGVRTLLERDPEAAVAQLDTWRDETVHALRLDKVRSKKP